MIWRYPVLTILRLQGSAKDTKDTKDNGAHPSKKG